MQLKGRKWLHKTAAKRAAIRTKSLSPNKQAQAQALVTEEVKFISEVVDWEYIVNCYYNSYGGVNKEKENTNNVKL